MDAHFEVLATARDAVIRGDLDGAKAALTTLATHPTAEGLPEGWQPYVAELRTRAMDAEKVNDLQQAGPKVAEVAAECGACHQAMGASVKPWAPARPEPDMSRHAWGMERLWDSLVVPDAAAWTSGTAALSEVLRVREVDGKSEPMPLIVHVFAERVRRLAGAGAHASTPGERADLYGQLLHACAACHGRLGVDPAVAAPAPAPAASDAAK